MNQPRLPGFTAEASVRTASRHYACLADHITQKRGITPAQSAQQAGEIIFDFTSLSSTGCQLCYCAGKLRCCPC